MDELRRLFEYNRWATLRILDALDELSPEELRLDLESSFPSVLDTLVHALGAEWVWLQRWKGTSPTDFPDAGALDSAVAVRTRWNALWEDQRALLAGWGAGDVGRPVSYRQFNGYEDTRPLGELLRHVVNHATYHRGQIVTMLRQLGREPPSTDYVRWLREVEARGRA